MARHRNGGLLLGLALGTLLLGPTSGHAEVATDGTLGAKVKLTDKEVTVPHDTMRAQHRPAQIRATRSPCATIGEAGGQRRTHLALAATPSCREPPCRYQVSWTMVLCTHSPPP
jgi:hypothetical protein